MFIKYLLFGTFFCLAFENILANREPTVYDVTLSQMKLEDRLQIDPHKDNVLNEPLGIPYMGGAGNDSLKRSARFAVKQKDYDKAEFFYMKLLSDADYPLPERMETLLELADMHAQNHALIKLAAILENFIDVGKKDSRLPEIYLKLGRTYRILGDLKKSQFAFNQVLNVSIGFAKEDTERIEQAALKAKLEIVDNFFFLEDYDEAERYLKRMQQVKRLAPADRQKIDWQLAQLHLARKQFALARLDFEAFLNNYPDSPLFLQAQCHLSTAYRQLGLLKEALQQVQQMIDNQQSAKNDPLQALYWKGQAGNQLANSLYEQGNYLGALTIYQSMVNLNSHYTWQWPVLYQIGLCYEKMNALEKARESYRVMVEGSGDLPVHRPEVNERLNADLEFIQSQAKWRLELVNRRLAFEIGL
jgi:tetratricopeptide (TPR) repeat protein